MYRNVLARQLRLLGYDIENRRESKGRDRGFEIRGIPDELLTKYSQRSRQRDEAMQQFLLQNGRQPTDNEIAVLIRETRADRLIEISTAEVRKRQRERLTPAESLSIAEVRPHSHGRPIELEPAQTSLDYAKDRIFERLSVAHDHHIVTEALQHGRGRIDHEELKGRLGLEEASGAILRDGSQVATAESLQRERKMIDSINRGIGTSPRLGGTKPFVALEIRLRPEQKHAIQFVLDSHDRAVNIQGAAGTGKTATLRETHRALRDVGQEVLALAPTMSRRRAAKGGLQRCDHHRAAAPRPRGRIVPFAVRS